MSRLSQTEIINCVFLEEDEINFKVKLNFIPTKLKIIKMFKYDVNNNTNDEIKLSLINESNLIENKNYDITNFQTNNKIKIHCFENENNIHMTLTLIVEFSKYIEKTIFDPFASFIIPQKKSLEFNIDTNLNNQKIKVVDELLDNDVDEWEDMESSNSNDKMYLPIFNFNSIGDIILRTLILSEDTSLTLSKDQTSTLVNINTKSNGHIFYNKLINSVFNNEYIIINGVINWKDIENETRLVIFDRCLQKNDYNNKIFKQMKKYIVIDKYLTVEMKKNKFDTIFIDDLLLNDEITLDMAYEYFFSKYFSSFFQYEDCIEFYANKILFDMDELYTYKFDEENIDEFKVETITKHRNILIITNRDKHIKLLNNLIEINDSNKNSFYNSNTINNLKNVEKFDETIIFEYLTKNTETFNNLIFNGRQLNKSVIMITNSLNDVKPMHRNQFNYIFMFNDDIEELNNKYNVNISKKIHDCYIIDNNNKLFYMNF